MIQKFFSLPKNIRYFYGLLICQSCLFFLPVEALILQEDGMTLTQITWIYALHSLATFILEIPTSVISDSMGRKKTFILSSFFMFLAVIALSIGQSLMFFMIYAGCMALARALYSGSDEAFLVESLKEAKQENKISLCMNISFMTWNVVAALASLCGIFMAKVHVDWTAYFSLIPLSVAFVLLFLIHEPRVEHEKNIISILGFHIFLKNALSYVMRHDFLKKLTIFFVTIASVDVAWHYYAPLLHEFKTLPIEWIGVLGALYFAFSGLGAFLLVFLEKYFSQKHIIIISTISIPFLLLGGVLAQNPMLYVFCFTLANLPWGLRHSVLRRQFQENAAPEMRATVSSIASLGMELSGFLFLMFLLSWSTFLNVRDYYFIIAFVLFLTCFFPSSFYWRGAVKVHSNE